MLRYTDVLAGVAGAAATIPLLALGLTVLRGRARRALQAGAELTLAAVLGAAVVAALRGGSAPWRGVTAVEGGANAVLALACACALVPPINARLGSTKLAAAVAALAGGAVVLRGGLALGIHSGLAARDDAVRLFGVAIGVAMVCVVTAVIVAVVRRARAETRPFIRPALVAVGGTVAVSAAVALACAERVLFPIQLRVSMVSIDVRSGSLPEAVMEGVTGIAHSVPRAQVAAVFVAIVVGAPLAAWQTRSLAPEERP